MRLTPYRLHGEIGLVFRLKQVQLALYAMHFPIPGNWEGFKYTRYVKGRKVRFGRRRYLIAFTAFWDYRLP